jgi:Amt family ammonium transporter
VGTQLYGVAVYAGFTLVCAAAIFGLIKVTMGLRVSEEEEIEGLDYGEHEMHAYDMGISTTSVSRAEVAPQAAE